MTTSGCCLHSFHSFLPVDFLSSWRCNLVYSPVRFIFSRLKNLLAFNVWLSRSFLLSYMHWNAGKTSLRWKIISVCELPFQNLPIFLVSTAYTFIWSRQEPKYETVCMAIRTWLQKMPYEDLFKFQRYSLPLSLFISFLVFFYHHLFHFHMIFYWTIRTHIVCDNCNASSVSKEGHRNAWKCVQSTAFSMHKENYTTGQCV